MVHINVTQNNTKKKIITENPLNPLTEANQQSRAGICLLLAVQLMLTQSPWIPCRPVGCLPLQYLQLWQSNWKKQQWRGWLCVMYYCFLVWPRTIQSHLTPLLSKCILLTVTAVQSYMTVTKAAGVGLYFTVHKSLCRQCQKTCAANTALEVAISHRAPLSALQNKSSWTPELSWTKGEAALAVGQG